jgi:hypothetical protein
MSCFRNSLSPSGRISCCNNCLLQRESYYIIFLVSCGLSRYRYEHFTPRYSASLSLYFPLIWRDSGTAAYLPSPTLLFTDNVFVFEHKAETLSVIGFWELQTWTLTDTVQFNYNSQHKVLQTRLCRHRMVSPFVLLCVLSRGRIFICWLL